MNEKTAPSRVSFRILLCICVGAAWWLPQTAWANCLGMYQQKKYVSAAKCMASKAQQLRKRNRSESGRWMRNAIKAWQLAADTAKEQTRVAYYREEAYLLIKLHNKEKLYEDLEQRNRLRQVMRRLLRQINYSSLIVIANHPRAQICVSGFAFRKCLRRPLWSTRVRPGAYKVSVSYPLVPPISRTRETILKPGKQGVLLFRPPYANVSIVTNDGKASMSLTGGGLSAPLRGSGALWTVLLPPGKYTLKLKYPTHPIKQHGFVIERAEPKVLTFTRPPDLPVLRIESSPPKARVLINGKPKGKTILSLPLAAGEHKVQLLKHCYLPINKMIRTQPGKENALTVVLKRDPAYLQWQRRKENEKLFKIIGWVGFGVGLAALGVSAATHIASSDLQSSAIADLRANRISNFQSFQEKGQLGNDLRTVGYITLGAGSAFLIGGIASLLLSPAGSLQKVKCQIPIDPPKPKQ